ncbi:MAG: hypothetical protein Q9227_000360 [Pyrenula ochraceoflavens]
MIIPSFPPFQGPFAVGTKEYEIPVSEIPASSSPPKAGISTIKFRLFFPTEKASASSSKQKSILWLPDPQHKWVKAYAAFLGLSPRISNILSWFPNFLSYIRIQAIKDAPLKATLQPQSRYPTLIFSHGLGGSFNTYSYFLGSLASHGIICCAPEHRDQSAPISVIRNDKDKTTIDIKYQAYAHDPRPEIFSARNEQLSIRLWELELIYTALQHLNDGNKPLTNLADSPNKSSSSPPPNGTPDFTNTLDLSPGHVIWSGHSFGATTIVQFLKTVFYSQSISTTSNNNAFPLHRPAASSSIHSQITAESPTVLLDLWTMPLADPCTKSLWDLPLPCYSSPPPPPPPPNNPSTSTPHKPGTTTLAIMSSEFHSYTKILSRTISVLSPPSPSNPSPTPSSSPPTHPTSSNTIAKLFYTRNSAHMSQSDFGLLFRWAMKRWLRVEDPEWVLRVNVGAVVEFIRGFGWGAQEVAESGVDGVDGLLDDGDEGGGEKDGVGKGWVRVPLLLGGREGERDVRGERL